MEVLLLNYTHLIINERGKLIEGTWGKSFPPKKNKIRLIRKHSLSKQIVNTVLYEKINFKTIVV